MSTVNTSVYVYIIFTTICYLPDDDIITRFTFIHEVVQNYHPHWPWNGPHCQTLHLFLNFYLLVVPTLLGLTTYNVERIMHWIKLMVSMPVSQYSSKSGRPVHDLITQLLHYCSSMYFFKVIVYMHLIIKRAHTVRNNGICQYQ